MKTTPLALFAFLLIASLGHAQFRNHDYNPNNPGNPYNLTDLDNDLVSGEYAYCKSGNLMSAFYQSAPHGVPLRMYLKFTRLTDFSGPTLDLFLSDSETTPHILDFPADSVFTLPTDTIPGSIYSLETIQSRFLFRKLHFKNSLSVFSETATQVPLTAQNMKLIVLIHGWNPSSNPYSYNDEFAELVSALYLKIQNTDWRLVLYRWEADADTGPGFPSDHPIANPTKSAEIAHQHGQHLGELLHIISPELQKVQFIVHSAGTWAARSATRYLLQNTRAKVQVSLLDPFIPGKLHPNDSQLTEDVISAMPSMPQSSPGQLVLLENYYAEDGRSGLLSIDSDAIWSATSGRFAWSDAIGVQQRVDWGFTGIPWVSLWYDAHSGPIQFYADTVNSADIGGLSSGGLENGDFDLNNIGWKRSMFYHEQAIRPTVTAVSPRVLNGLPAAQTQAIAITGTRFTSGSKLRFTRLDDNFTYLDRMPQYINETELRYDIAVGPTARSWSLKVVNEDVESSPYTFYVVSGGSQLSGLSISGPAAMSENDSRQFAATAFFSDGSTQTVTPIWRENSSVTTISTSGVLTAGSVSSDTAVTVSASYSVGGITKTASADVTVVNSGGGGTQTQELIVNGGFEAGSTGWTLSGFVGTGIGALGQARSGTYWLWLAGSPNESDAAYQTITIPANATAATLSYYYNINSQEVITTAYDKFTNTIRNTSGTILATVINLSNIDQDPAGGNPYYHLVTFDVLPYAGQPIRIHFASVSDGLKATNFRIDDVSVQAVVPPPVALTSLVIAGPSSVVEEGTARYSAVAVFSDGSTNVVTPNGWGENSAATTISSSGLLTAGQVSADTSVSLYASFTYSGVTQEAYKDVTVLDVAPAFSYLAISGPSSINENSSGQFTAAAIFSDGTSQSVSPSWWENSTATSISASGRLTAGGVTRDTTVTVSASYTIGAVTCNASQAVLIVNIPAPVTLSSIAISGPSSLNENSTAQFSATAFFSDNSSQTVSPAWSVDTTTTTISSSGLFSAGEVTSDTVVTISGSYTTSGTTRSAQKLITVINTNGTPTTRVITLIGNLAFGNVAVGSSAQRTLGMTNRGNTTLTVSNISYPNGFSGNWSGTIDAGGLQSIAVSFSPTSSNSYGGSVTVNSDKTSGVNTIAASGTGTITTTRVISVSGNLAFGDVLVDSSAQNLLTIANEGNAILTVSNIGYPSGFSGDWSGTIAAGGLRYVLVTFAPTTINDYGGTVTVNSDKTSGVKAIAASGTGTTPTLRIVSISGDLAFGDLPVGGSGQNLLTIANLGSSTLTVTRITYPSGFSGSWSGTIAAGASQYVLVTFAPTSNGSFGGNVVVTSDATSGSNAIVASGNGISTDPPPVLWTQIQSNNLILSWPTNAGFFTLEATTNIAAAASWNPVSTVPTILNGLNVVTNPIVGPGKFFRLRQ